MYLFLFVLLAILTGGCRDILVGVMVRVFPNWCDLQ